MPRKGNNSHSLKPNKQPLIVNQRSIIPITQLINPIHTSYQNQHNRKAQKPHKHLEPRIQLRPLALLGAAPSAPVADGVIGREADEERQSEDLEGEAGQSDVDADVGSAVAVGGHAAAGGLQGERDDVAGDEDIVVGGGGKAGVLGIEVGYAVGGCVLAGLCGEKRGGGVVERGEDGHLGECEVDGGGVEGGANGYAYCVA
jgi:hypothetical protein